MRVKIIILYVIIILQLGCTKEKVSRTIVYGTVTDAILGKSMAEVKVYVINWSEAMLKYKPSDSVLTDMDGHYEIEFLRGYDSHDIFIRAVHPISGKYGQDLPQYGSINKINFELYP